MPSGSRKRKAAKKPKQDEVEAANGPPADLQIHSGRKGPGPQEDEDEQSLTPKTPVRENEFDDKGRVNGEWVNALDQDAGTPTSQGESASVAEENYLASAPASPGDWGQQDERADYQVSSTEVSACKGEVGDTLDPRLEESQGAAGDTLDPRLEESQVDQASSGENEGDQAGTGVGTVTADAAESEANPELSDGPRVFETMFESATVNDEAAGSEFSSELASAEDSSANAASTQTVDIPIRAETEQTYYDIDIPNDRADQHCVDSDLLAGTSISEFQTKPPEIADSETTEIPIQAFITETEQAPAFPDTEQKPDDDKPNDEIEFPTDCSTSFPSISELQTMPADSSAESEPPVAVLNPASDAEPEVLDEARRTIEDNEAHLPDEGQMVLDIGEDGDLQDETGNDTIDEDNSSYPQFVYQENDLVAENELTEEVATGNNAGEGTLLKEDEQQILSGPEFLQELENDLVVEDEPLSNVTEEDEAGNNSCDVSKEEEHQNLKIHVQDTHQTAEESRTEEDEEQALSNPEFLCEDTPLRPEESHTEGGDQQTLSNPEFLCENTDNVLPVEEELLDNAREGKEIGSTPSEEDQLVKDDGQQTLFLCQDMQNDPKNATPEDESGNQSCQETCILNEDKEQTLSNQGFLCQQTPSDLTESKDEANSESMEVDNVAEEVFSENQLKPSSNGMWIDDSKVVAQLYAETREGVALQDKKIESLLPTSEDGSGEYMSLVHMGRKFLEGQCDMKDTMSSFQVGSEDVNSTDESKPHLTQVVLNEQISGFSDTVQENGGLKVNSECENDSITDDSKHCFTDRGSSSEAVNDNSPSNGIECQGPHEDLRKGAICSSSESAISGFSDTVQENGGLKLNIEGEDDSITDDSKHCFTDRGSSSEAVNDNSLSNGIECQGPHEDLRKGAIDSSSESAIISKEQSLGFSNILAGKVESVTTEKVEQSSLSEVAMVKEEEDHVNERDLKRFNEQAVERGVPRGLEQVHYRTKWWECCGLFDLLLHRK